MNSRNSTDEEGTMDVQTEPGDHSLRAVFVTVMSSIAFLVVVLSMVYPLSLILPIGFSVTDIITLLVICLPLLVIGNILMALRGRYW